MHTQILFINCNRREKEKTQAVEGRVHKHSLVRAGLWSPQRATLNGLLQVAVPEQVFLIPWTGIFFCSQAVNQMCHLLVHQLQMALPGWKFTDFRVRSGYCNHMNCLYPCKDQTLSPSNSCIEHTTSAWTVLFGGKKPCVGLKYANDGKSTTCQHKLLQWLMNTLKNVNFILSYYFKGISSLLRFYFHSFNLF